MTVAPCDATKRASDFWAGKETRTSERRRRLGGGESTRGGLLGNDLTFSASSSSVWGLPCCHALKGRNAGVGPGGRTILAQQFLKLRSCIG